MSSHLLAPAASGPGWARPTHPGRAEQVWLGLVTVARVWRRWPDSPWFDQALAAWISVFMAGFFVLPAEWTQRAWFYGGLPLTLPAVLAVARDVWAAPLARALAGFLTWSALSALWSDHWLSVGDQTRKAACIAYFLALCCALGRRGAAAWWRVLVAVQAFAAIAAVIMAAWFLLEAPDADQFVGFGQFANSNYAAGVTGVTALMGLACMLDAPHRRTPLLLLLCQAPIAYLLVLTGGRAGLLAYVSGIGLCVVLIAARRGWVMPRRVGVSLLVAMTLVPLAAASRGTDWIQSELARGDTYRLQLWAVNWQRIQERPWFGYGSTSTDLFWANGHVEGYHAHNLFLAQWYYGGLPGLLLWTLVVALSVRAAARAWRDGGHVLPAAALWFLLAVGMVDMGWLVVDLQSVWLYAWTVLGLVLSYDVAARRRAAITAR